MYICNNITVYYKHDLLVYKAQNTDFEQNLGKLVCLFRHICIFITKFMGLPLNLRYRILKNLQDILIYGP